ncbi:MAG: 50S ribosomal protein L25 [Patescibacteria group bacterium]
MEKIVLKAKLRDIVQEKVKKIRRDGWLPLVVYGQKKDNVNLMVNFNEFVKVYRAAGNNSIVELDVEGKEKENVLLVEIDYHPLTDLPRHADALRVNMLEKISTAVPINFIGVSKAVKDLGGTFIANISSFDVTCLPADLPKVIEVDISSLNTFEDMIYVKDVVVSDKVKIERELDDVVAKVAEPRSAEELAELDKEVEENVDKVEVEKAKKEGETTEEGEKKEEKK